MRWKLLLILFLFLFTSISYAITINNIKSPVKLNTNRITFTFSSNVIPKRLVGKFTNEPLLKCSNDTVGTFEVVSQNTLNFYPDKPFYASQKISCEVNPDKFKNVIWSNKKTTFYTENFKIEDIRAEKFNDKISIYLSFNDKTYPSEIFKKLSLNYQKKFINYSIFPEEGVSKNFILTPLTKKTLPQITVKIRDYIYSDSGAKLNKKIIKTLKFNNDNYVKLPKKPLMNNFETLSISDFEGNIKLRIYMNDVEYWEKVINQNPLNFISVTPKVNFTINNREYLYFYTRDRDKKYIELIGDFKPASIYKIRLKKGLETNRFVLKKDKILKVITKDRLPAISFINKKEFVSNKGNAIKIRITNLNNIKVTLERLLPQNFRYFTIYENRKSQNFSKYASIIYQTKKDMNPPKNKFVTDFIDISNVLKKYPSGIFRLKLYATFKYKNRYGKYVTKVLNPSKLLYISDVGITAKISEKQIFVLTQSIATTKGMANVKITLYSDKNTIITKGNTNKDGVWLLNFKKKLLNKPKAVVVEYKNDKNVFSIY